MKKTAAFFENMDKKCHVLTQFEVDISCQDLFDQIKTAEPRPEMVKIAEKTLESVRDVWKPAAVFRWARFQHNGTIGRIILDSDDYQEMAFGTCIQFLTHARYCMIGVYTAGRELEQAAGQASLDGNLLAAYFIDMISLIVLDRAGRAVNAVAEQQAGRSGWGVSPFLSPGSVRGWDLDTQKNLCSMVPLERIDVTIENDTILSPFKSLSCLVGIGPGYASKKVTIPCQV